MKLIPKRLFWGANAGQTALPVQTQRQVHLAIAEHNLAGRVIDQRRALRVVVNLFAAHAWDRATAFLFQLGRNVNEPAHARAFDLVALFFREQCPKDAPLAFRIVLRGVQIRILTFLARDACTFVADLDNAIAEAKGAKELSLAVGVLWLVGVLNPAASATALARSALRSFRISEQLPNELFFPPEKLAPLVWAALPRVKTQEDIRAILAVFREMTADERRASFQDEGEHSGPVLLADRCTSLEFEKVEADHDWPAAVTLLNEMLAVAALPGAKRLEAPTVRAKARVLADHLGQPQEALVLLDEAANCADRDGRFLLNDTAGALLLAYGTPEGALERYERALGEGVTGYSHLRFDTLRWASEAAGKSGRWEQARNFAIQGSSYTDPARFLLSALS